MLEKEYQNMFERTRSIDTRASFLLSILTATMPLYFNIFDWSRFKECFSGYLSFVKVSESAFFFISIVALLVCFLRCFSVISSRSYNAPNINIFNGFNLKEYIDTGAQTNHINVILMDLYIKSINHNDAVVKEKADRFRATITALRIFLFASIACIILNKL